MEDQGASSEQVLSWLAKEIANHDRQQQDFAKAIGTSNATMTRVVAGSTNPPFKLIYDLITEIVGKRIFIFKHGRLRSTLPYFNNSLLERFAREVESMNPSDIDLIFKFLAILKNRALFDVVQFGALLGILALMDDKVTVINKET